MSSGPDRPDLRQLRIDARELKRAFETGDPVATERVLASHPKFAGQPAERLEGWRISLRDAQATIAREAGFDSWRALIAELGDAPRWDAYVWSDIARRAFAEARALRHEGCLDVHFLLAVLKPPAPTAAAAVLDELGVTYEDVRQPLADLSRPRRRSTGTYSTPTYQLILGWAQGIAIGMGASQVTDEHVLLAIAYGDYGGESTFDALGIDADDLVQGLRARGVQTPTIDPPVSGTPAGPLGPWVYFPKADWDGVTRELARMHPPGTAHWGTNRSRWKKEHWYVVGEDSIPIEAIVRRAVRDPADVEVLPFADGSAREAAPTRPSPTPAER